MLKTNFLVFRGLYVKPFFVRDMFGTGSKFSYQVECINWVECYGRYFFSFLLFLSFFLAKSIQGYSAAVNQSQTGAAVNSRWIFMTFIWKPNLLLKRSNKKPNNQIIIFRSLNVLTSMPISGAINSNVLSRVLPNSGLKNIAAKSQMIKKFTIIQPNDDCRNWVHYLLHFTDLNSEGEKKF